MITITSKMSLPEKLRAHADNVSHHEIAPGMSWCMRDAANVIDALNEQIVKLEDAYNDYVNNPTRQVGEGQE